MLSFYIIPQLHPFLEAGTLCPVARNPVVLRQLVAIITQSVCRRRAICLRFKINLHFVYKVPHMEDLFPVSQISGKSDIFGGFPTVYVDFPRRYF